ncbi:hypothetical protein ACFQZZ_17980 [Nocardia sp. GCM10030253]|uniref:hypothetical protein n=1 Tax=Nocardia sp. GCM10030253 TaxID=3273404 RepID=UPI003625B5EB
MTDSGTTGADNNNLLWVAPDACTLPTAEQPLRVAEFADLFAAALRHIERPSPIRLRLELAATAEATARDLAARETDCCGFFAFIVEPTGQDSVHMTIEVPFARVEVLDGLAAQASAALSRSEK